jgi:ParB family transcriptional regulator, chromosome partitioning protein
MSITTDNRSEQVLATVEHIDPQTLEFEDNVREEVELDKEFLASLREHGVIIPIIAIRDAEGRTLVREGQRRTLGAREVGLTSVPVYVVPADAADADTATVQRIVQQVVANDRRKDLTDGQRARAIQQMLDTGMSAAKVAKKLAMSRDVVNAAGAAAKSVTALNALNDGQLDFRQAEVLTEFEDDPAAVERLLSAAGHGSQHFEHAVSSLRSQRETDALYVEAEKVYVEKGFTVLEDRPRWNDTSAIRLDYLRTVDDNGVSDDIEKEPAHWAVYLTEDYGYFDAETGDPVDDDDVDDQTRYNTDREAGEGLRHYSTVTEKTVVVPEWFCLDYQAAGLQLAPSLRDLHQRNERSGTAPAVDDSPEAIAERQAQQEEAERRDRRKVLVLNRLGQAAESVRREYVTKLLARKTAPKGAATFVAHCLTRDHFILNQNHGADITAELLGLDSDRDVRALVSDLGTNIDARAQVITLAIVLGSLEARTDKSAWRDARSGFVGRAPSPLSAFACSCGSSVREAPATPIR